MRHHTWRNHFRVFQFTFLVVNWCTNKMVVDTCDVQTIITYWFFDPRSTRQHAQRQARTLCSGPADPLSPTEIITLENLVSIISDIEDTTDFLGRKTEHTVQNFYVFTTVIISNLDAMCKDEETQSYLSFMSSTLKYDVLDKQKQNMTQCPMQRFGEPCIYMRFLLHVSNQCHISHTLELRMLLTLVNFKLLFFISTRFPLTSSGFSWQFCIKDKGKTSKDTGNTNRWT